MEKTSYHLEAVFERRLQQVGRDADEDVGLDPEIFSVVDEPYPHESLEGAEGLLDSAQMAEVRFLTSFRFDSLSPFALLLVGVAANVQRAQLDYDEPSQRVRGFAVEPDPVGHDEPAV